MKNISKNGLLRAGAALPALALMGAGFVAAVVSAPVAVAQDYTSGAIGGTVTDESGNIVSGATVTITSPSLGTTRTVTTGSNGTFRVTGLATGAYNVDVEGPSGGTYRAEGVNLPSSTTVTLDIGLSTGEAIVVTGARIKQAFTGTTTGLNVDVSDLVKTTPVARNLTSVILMAPGTTSGDNAFGNLASIGGSSVAENAYYINGLNITNFDNYLGGARVPFEFYKSVEVKSGGYPAEYGRATGGIINAVTKSGTNEFTAAIHLNWEPNFLYSQGKELASCDSPSRCTTIKQSNYSAIAEAGGPIIKDRLFVYGLVEFRRDTKTTGIRGGGYAYSYKDDDPFWGAKIDAYPIDSQHLEFTIFDTRHTTTRSDFSYNADDSGNYQIGSVANSISNFN